MNHSSALLTLALLVSLPAFAGDDDPIPYSDDAQEKSRPRSRPVPATVPAEVESEDTDRDYYRMDDPTLGLGAELLGGIMLVDSSQGALVETSAGMGVRGVWEFGRLFLDDYLQKALFADVTWAYTGQKHGTQLTFVSSRYHYFTVAPAWMFRFGEDSPFGAYLQLGAGLSVLSATLSHNNNATSVTGLKSLIQYGGGFRFVPKLSADGTYRLAFRLELTRFRRGYMDDTFIGVSAGAVF